MTHNEERTHWLREGAIGLGVGILYGVTSVAVGHPFDTMKTKMQAQHGFDTGGMLRAFSKTWRAEGIVGLYRGCVPPLWGSGIFRSTQFAVFESVYTGLSSSNLFIEPVPFTGGVQGRVLVGGILASTARAVIECPLEVAKIRRQTGQTWTFGGLYSGFGVTWVRTLGLMTTYFVLIDSGRRHCPDLFSRSLVGPFLASGFAATAAWWLVWPLEYMKSQVQGQYGQAMPTWRRLRLTVAQRGGFLGLYRGLLPGTIRSFLANGTSMVVMQFAQRKVSELGLRKS